MSYYINTFDDSHEKYKNIVNIWNITKWWKGKVSLKNGVNSSITINVISHWKITPIENNNNFNSNSYSNSSPR
jgi:hypothetical protein